MSVLVPLRSVYHFAYRHPHSGGKPLYYEVTAPNQREAERWMERADWDGLYGPPVVIDAPPAGADVHRVAI